MERQLAKEEKRKHFKELWGNLIKHNENMLKEKNLRLSPCYLNDETVIFMKQHLWDSMQNVLQEVVTTYGWEDMNLQLESKQRVFWNFEFAELVREYYLGYFTQDAFKMCFRMILINSIHAWINGHDIYTKQFLLANESLI